MKYSLEFKLECIKKYKKGIKVLKPNYANCSQEIFSNKVRKWVRLFDLHGIDGLKHKQFNKEWSQEERFELVVKVLTGNSISSTAIEAGIDDGQLYSWIKKYNKEGYDDLKLNGRGRPSKENYFMPKPDNKDTKLTASEKEELKLLRRRNEYLEAENAYLKKVSALAMKKSAKAKKQVSFKNSSKKDTD